MQQPTKQHNNPSQNNRKHMFFKGNTTSSEQTTCQDLKTSLLTERKCVKQAKELIDVTHKKEIYNIFKYL